MLHRACKHCENFIVCDIFFLLFYTQLRRARERERERFQFSSFHIRKMINARCNFFPVQFFSLLFLFLLCFGAKHRISCWREKRLLNWIKYMEKERLCTLNKSMVNLLLNDDQTMPTRQRNVMNDEHHFRTQIKW